MILDSLTSLDLYKPKSFTMEWHVQQTESGVKLLSFLKDKLGNNYSAKFIKQALESNLCRVNGRPEKFANTILGAGDHIALHEDVLRLKKPPLTDLQLKVLYEDSELIAVDKAAGLAYDNPHFFGRIRAICPSAKPVHRLDKETSGLILFAKTLTAEKALAQLFKARKIRKTYLAIVDGIPAKNAGIVRNYIGKLPSSEGQVVWGRVHKDKGVLAITEWRLEKKAAHAALLHCSPITGRTHQIRVHLSGLGHPILGDKQYGKKVEPLAHFQRCMLHAYKVEFVHPSTQKMLKLEAPPPADFIKALHELSLR